MFIAFNKQFNKIVYYSTFCLTFFYIISILDIKNEPRKVSQSIERYCCDFTSDERRILYDNAVKNTKLSNHDNINNEFTMG